MSGDASHLGGIRRGLIILFFAVLAVCIAIIAGLAIVAANGQDRIAIDNSIHLTRSVLADYERRLAQTVLDYSYWDEAVANLVTAPDLEWADDNVGVYLYDAFGISSSYVVDENDRASYRMVGGERVESDPSTRLPKDIAGLIEEARAEPPAEVPVPASGLVANGDAVHIAAAGVLTDYDSSSATSVNMPTGSALVVTRALDPDLLAEIGGNYLLDDLRLVLQPATPATPALPLFIVGGEAVGFLAWHVALPGQRMLAWVIPSLIVGFLALMALSFVFLARTERAVRHFVSQDELLDTEKKLRRHQSELAHMARVTTMGEMASTLAHELNQPLTSIVNYADGSILRLRRGAGANNADIVDALKRISDQAVRASDMIRHIAKFVTKTEAETGPIDVNRAIRRVVGLIEPETKQKRIELRLQLAEPLAPVTASSIQVEQVILNLLRNGIESYREAEAHEREIVVQTGPSTADIAAVEVAVTDHGCGLSDVEKEKAFEPFFTTKRDGMGMGLAISRSIVEGYGGRLWAAANPDRGMTVRFTLPGAGDATAS